MLKVGQYYKDNDQFSVYDEEGKIYRELMEKKIYRIDSVDEQGWVEGVYWWEEHFDKNVPHAGKFAGNGIFFEGKVEV